MRFLALMGERCAAIMFNEFVRFFWGQDSRAVLRLPAEPTCQVPIIRDISRGAAPRGDQGEPS